MNTAAEAFHLLHRPGRPLILPNAWDAGSARLITNLGAAAIATTSAGVAWAHGVPDGGHLTPAAQVDLAHQIRAATTLPVTMDIENGYSSDPSDVAWLVASLAAAGVVGVNLEDSTAGVQRRPSDFATLLTAVRDSLAADGVSMFINARIDSYLLNTKESTGDVLDRARAYCEAGADGIFLAGLADLGVIERACQSLPAPVNVMVPAADLTIQNLSQVGVARISTGMWLSQLAYGATQSAAVAMLAGSLTPPSLVVGDYADLNKHMTQSH